MQNGSLECRLSNMVGPISVYIMQNKKLDDVLWDKQPFLDLIENTETDMEYLI
jgi:hypothetical protein